MSSSIDQLKCMPSVSEVFFSFAAQDGKCAARKKFQGSYYCKYLARVLRKYAWEEDLETMLKRVENLMRSETVYIKNRRCIMSTSFKGFGWNKKLYFNPGIYHDNLHTIEKKIFRSEDEIKILSDKVADLQDRNAQLEETFSTALSDLTTAENCLRLYQMAVNNRLLELMCNAEAYIQSNFERVCTVNRNTLLELPFDSLVSFMSSDNFRVRNQDVLLRFLLDWVQHNTFDRRIRMQRVLNKVEFSKCSARYLEEVASCELLADGYFQAKIERAQNQQRAKQPLFIIGGYTHRTDTTNAVEAFNTNRNEWVECRNENAPSGLCSVFPLGQDLLVITASETYGWNPHTLEKTELNHMQRDRTNFCAAMLEGKVYILGGAFDGVTATRECTVYDTASNEWSTIAPMNENRQYASAAALNGEIYCAGGCNGSTPSRSVEKYNPDSKGWIEIEEMRLSRCHFSLVTRGDTIFAVGGLATNGESVSGVEMYSSESGVWEDKKEMLSARAAHSAVLMGPDIYVAGGYTESGKSTTEIYRCSEDKWEKGPDLNLGRAASATCLL